MKMSDDEYLYDEAPGLKELLERAEDRTLTHVTSEGLREIERKTEVLQRFNQANSRCIEQMKISEDAIRCRKAWERHTITLMAASSDTQVQQLEADDPLPRIVQNHGPDEDAISRLAHEINEVRHPFLKRLSS
jgi:hypothetical protein